MSLLDSNVINPVSLLFSNVNPGTVHPVGDKVYVRLPEIFTIRGELVTSDKSANALKLTAISKYSGKVDSIYISLPVHIPCKANEQEMEAIKKMCSSSLAPITIQVKAYIDAFRR